MVIVILLIIALIAILLCIRYWEPSPTNNWGKIITATLALLFTFGSGFCAVGSVIFMQPVAILALAACGVGVMSCRAMLKWQRGLAYGRIHPLVLVSSAIALTVAAYVVTAFTVRLAG